MSNHDAGGSARDLRRAAYVRMLPIETMTATRKLELNTLPFSMDYAQSLCHRCAADGMDCDLPKMEREQFSVVKCEAREFVWSVQEEEHEAV